MMPGEGQESFILRVPCKIKGAKSVLGVPPPPKAASKSKPQLPQKALGLLRYNPIENVLRGVLFKGLAR